MSKPNLNVTPLIDVLLVLLVIFMIVAPQKHQNYRGSIPQESTADARTNPLSLVVEISQNGEVLLNRATLGTIADSKPLTEKLNEIFTARAQNGVVKNSDNGNAVNEIEKTVFIKAPKSLNYGTVINVVDSVRASGAQPISFQVDSLN